MNKVVLTGNDLTLEELVEVTRNHVKAVIDEKAIADVNKSREYVEEIVEEERVVYGINTGFGSLSRVSISKEDSAQLQENIIRTHASGFGNPLPEDETRAVMLIRINSLLKGVSGIRLSTIELLLEMLNRNVVPFIPEKGSLGASGDLAPLAHMVLPMLGLGKAYYEGELLPGKVAMEKAGLKPIALQFLLQLEHLHYMMHFNFLRSLISQELWLVNLQEESSTHSGKNFTQLDHTQDHLRLLKT